MDRQGSILCKFIIKQINTTGLAEGEEIFAMREKEDRRK